MEELNFGHGKIVDIPRRVESACNAALIGDDDRQQPAFVAKLDRLARAVNPLESRDFPKITDFLVEDAVSVEENCLSHMLSSAKNFRNVNVRRTVEAVETSRGTPIGCNVTLLILRVEENFLPKVFGWCPPAREIGLLAARVL